MADRIVGVDHDGSSAFGASKDDVIAQGFHAVRYARRSILFAVYGFIPLVALVAYRWAVGFVALTAIALAFAIGAATNNAHGQAHRRYQAALAAGIAANLAYLPRVLKELEVIGEGAYPTPSLFQGAPPAQALGLAGVVLLALASLAARKAHVEAQAAIETERARERARTQFATAMERGKAHADPGPITRAEIEARRASGEAAKGPMMPTPGRGTPAHVNVRDERHPNRDVLDNRPGRSS